MKSTVKAADPSKWVEFGRFLTVGGLSYLVDVGVLVVLDSWAGWSVPAATTGAYLAAFVFTFTLNRLWVFRAGDGAATGQVFRYLVLVGINYLLTLGIVVGLTELGVAVVVAKTVATGVIAVGNFVVYRAWVFRTPGEPVPPL